MPKSASLELSGLNRHITTIFPLKFVSDGDLRGDILESDPLLLYGEEDRDKLEVDLLRWF